MDMEEAQKFEVFLTIMSLELRLLPKLDLKKFDGNIARWPSFWHASEFPVHHNTRLSP